MNEAIVTKYLAATRTRGARIKAACASGSLTIPYPRDMRAKSAHWTAAEMLIKKLDWLAHEWNCGTLPDCKTFVFVFRD